MAMIKTGWGHTNISKATGGSCFRYMKYGSGKEGARREREREPRSLATDLINLPFVGDGENWGEEMDATREMLRRTRSGAKRKTRTFAHFILSPNPEDNITLEQLREIATAWANEMFNLDDPFIGAAEVAIEYHDDNEKHIPHAHLIVNNVDLRNGHALQINKAQGARMALRLQELAWERGLRAFDENGVSRLATEKPPARIERKFDATPEERATMPELKMQNRHTGSWKQEIKNAIEIACQMADTPEEVVDRLAQMNIIAMPRQAKRVRPGEDFIFYYPQPGVPLEQNKKRVSGERLGKRYTAAGMRAQIRVSHYRKLYAEDKDAAALLDMLVDVRDIEVQRGQTLADLAAAFAAINNFHLTNMQDAQRSLDRLRKRQADGEGDRIVANQIKQLETLLRIGPAANIVPAMREQSRTARAIEARKPDAVQKRREAKGEKISVEEKIEKGYRFTKEEWRKLSTAERGLWRTNRNRAEMGRGPLKGGGKKGGGGVAGGNHGGISQSRTRGSRSR